MADIELVIKIDEEDYQFFKENFSHLKIKKHLIDTRDNRNYIAIAKGTPLPKGHGDLIDKKELRLDIIAHKYSNDFCKEHNIDQSINVGMLNILIADAPTIIEADKGE